MSTKRQNDDGTSRDDSLASKQEEGPVTSDAPLADTQKPIVSNPAIQYVASTRDYPFLRGDIVLSGSIDEAEIANGWRIWSEMALDPTAQGIQLWTKVNTLVDGFTIEPRQFLLRAGSESPNDEDVQQALWSAQYVGHVLCDQLEMDDRPMLSILWDMLDGIREPYKVAEVTYNTLRFGDFKGFPGIKCIRPKPRENYNIVLDEMNNWRGVVGLVPGGSQALWSGFIKDASVIPNCIAAEKLAWFYAADEDGIPRSLWNGMYAPWARLQLTYRDYIDAISASCGAKVSLEMSDDQRGLDFQDPRTGETVSAIEQTRRAAEKWTSSGVLITLPDAKTTVWYPPASMVQGFQSTVKQWQREMCMSIAIDSKAIMEGEHGSGLSDDKSDENADPVISLIQLRVCWLLNRLAFNLLKLAKGREFAYRYSPIAAMGKAATADYPDAGETTAAMFTAKAVFPSQLDSIADKTGVNRPTAAEKVAYTLVWNAQNELAKNPPSPIMGTEEPNPKKIAPGTKKDKK
jgi:hypothetical protein